MGGGSAAGGGFEFQAFVSAYVAAHVLAGRGLRWCDTWPDVPPLAIRAETGGAGDDLAVEFGGGQPELEVQAKRGLNADDRFWEAIMKLARFVQPPASKLGAIAVDSTSSATVRVSFNDDLRRIADGILEGLQPTATEFVNRLRSEGLDPEATAKKLAVVVVDTAPRELVALEMLRSVVGEAEAGHAWAVLKNDGLTLIRRRGRRDLDALIALLDAESVRLLQPQTFTPVRYRRWLAHIAGTFVVPGLNVTIPIAYARFRVRLWSDGKDKKPKSIAEWLKTYREWERLAEGYSREGVDVHHIDRLPQKLAVIAGPGAGKSTLLRKIAYHLSEAGHVVFWIRAPVVLRHMLSGKSFEEAARLAATDGFGGGVPSNDLQIMAMLVDGLDECDDRRGEVASAIRKWAAGHPSTRIIVTSRPVGHDLSLLPEWQHAELLPMDDEQRRQFVSRLLSTVTGNADSTTRFFLQADRSRAASLAARNPLLLGFLVALFLDGEEFSDRRSDLLERVVERLRTHPLGERETDVAVAPVVARRVLHCIGWHLLHDPESPRSRLVELAASRIGATSLADIAAVESAFVFWEQRRLLDRFTLASTEMISFTHLSLAEFAAACEAVRLSPEALRDWVRKVRRAPRWRETIVLAASRDKDAALTITDELLKQDDATDAASTEAMLAAAALVETGSSDSALIQRCSEQLSTRLSSPIPEVSFDAQRSLVALAQLAPAIVGATVKGLVESPQSWTRLCAAHVGLRCGDGHYDAAAVTGIVKQYFGPPVERVPELDRTNRMFVDLGDQDIRSKILVRYTELAVTSGQRDRIESLEQLLSTIVMTMGAIIDVFASLRMHGQTGMVERLSALRNRNAIDIKHRDYDPKPADRCFLESLLRICAVPSNNEPFSTDLPTIGLLLAAMQWMTAPAYSWEQLAQMKEPAFLDAALRAAVEAFDLSPKAIAREAEWALNNIDKLYAYDEQAGHNGFGLLEYTAPISPEADWVRAAKISTDADLLFGALLCGIGPVERVAAEVLAEGGGGAAADPLLHRALRHSHPGITEWAGPIAGARWGEKAIPSLREALAGEPTIASSNLLVTLATLLRERGDADMESLQPFLRALKSDETRIATAAAEALTRFATLPAEAVAEIAKGLDRRWKDREPSSSNSFLILDTPGRPLLETLLRLGAIDRTRLLDLTKHWDGGVANLAMSEILSSASDDELRSLVKDVHDGTRSTHVLKTLLALDDKRISSISGDLLNLLSAPLVEVRLIMLDSLPTAKWLEGETAREAARSLLDDVDLEVKSRAARVLRLLG